MCESAVYEEGNGLGSVDTRLCHDVQGSQENCTANCTFCANIFRKASMLEASHQMTFSEPRSSGMLRCDSIFMGGSRIIA